jgi:hypothetical protein
MRSFASKAFLLVIVLFAFAPLITRADTLTLSPASGSYSIGKSFPVTVYVSSVSQSVNAVSGTVTFPADKLQVVSVSKVGSVLSLWVSDPTFDNGAGTVNFEGVVPNPGYQGSAGKIVTINFKVIGSGTAAVKWSTASVLANDGSGTNILRNLNTASFSLGGTAPVTVPTVDTTVAAKPASGGVAVSSPTYPDPKKWYTADQGKFTWRLSDNATAVKILVGKLPNSDATVLYEPPIEEKTVNNIEDGVWYFHLAVRTASGYGPTTHFKFNVDSTPPDSFTIKPVESDDQTDPKPQFAFNAVDSTSGIDHYTVQIDSNDPVTWRDDGSGIYTPQALPPGSHTLLAKAYDAAGNSAPASVDFTILPITGPKITSYTEKVRSTSPLVVRGTAEPGNKVEITLKKSGLSKLVGSNATDENTAVQTVSVGEDGTFSLAVNTDKLSSGAYDLTAVAVDKRGARSEPTDAETVLINANWLQSLGSSLLSFLAVAVPVIALLVLLWLAVMHGFHRVRMTNRKFRSELEHVERLVDKAFLLLKEDVEDSIRLLEHTKSRRRLTGEEEAIIERFRANLRDADKVIHGEMRRIEKEID